MPLRYRDRRSGTGWPAALWLATAALLACAPAAFAQSPCDITATPASPFAGQPVTLCAPEGADSYNWFDSEGNPVGQERCLGYPGGLAAGTHDWMLMVTQGINNVMCPYSLVVADAPPPTCGITQSPPGELCAEQSFTLCGPEGDALGFAWRGAEGQVLGQERCLAVVGASAGDHTYHLTVSRGGASAACSAVVVVRACQNFVPNCPRGPAFWAGQCADHGRGKNRLQESDLAAVADVVDHQSSFFLWSESRGASFCDVLRPAKPMDARKRAQRQFAVLLANVAAGQLGLSTPKTGPIALEPTTPVACNGLQARTVAEVIVVVDGMLAQLEGQPMRSSRASYDRIVECLRGINRGTTIGPVCDEAVAGQAAEAAFEIADAFSGTSFTSTPFASGARLEFEIESGGEAVDLRIYDVAGRLVHRLARGVLPAGPARLDWHGVDDSGRRVPPGVFFVRGSIGNRPLTARLLLLR